MWRSSPLVPIVVASWSSRHSSTISSAQDTRLAHRTRRLPREAPGKQLRLQLLGVLVGHEQGHSGLVAGQVSNPLPGGRVVAERRENQRR